MEFRHASEADLPGAFAVFVAAQTELHSRRGAPWPARDYDPAAPWADVHRHLLGHDGERCFVAAHDGRLVGTTAAFVRGHCCFLPRCSSTWRTRVTALADDCSSWPGRERTPAGSRSPEAIQPRSTGLYMSHGLMPVTPVLTLSGAPVAPPVKDLLPIPPTTHDLSSLDLAAYGFDRAVDPSSGLGPVRMPTCGCVTAR
jgi:hypothetical protein